MKVNIKDKIIDVPDYFEIRGNMLYNNNTKIAEKCIVPSTLKTGFEPVKHLKRLPD